MQNVIFGLVSGSILALATVGFAMTRQTEGFLNIAHGQYLTIGAMVGIIFSVDLGMNIILSGFLTMLVLGVIGVIIARGIFQPVKRRGALVLLFTSIGLAYGLYGVAIAIFGTEIQLYSVDFGPSYDIGSASITLGEALIIALSMISVVGLWLFLTFTQLGTSIRAVSTNSDLAKVRGVRVQMVSSTVWFIAASFAGLAGMLLGILGSANVELGWSNILLILAIAVLGGVGRIYGVIAAGLLLGLVMSMSTLVIPTMYQTMVAFGVLILVLVFRPEGIFSTTRRKEQSA